MKLFTRLIFILAIGSCSTRQSNDPVHTESDNLSVEELENAGFEIFRESPEVAINIFKQVAKRHGVHKNYKSAGIANLNIANIFDEYLNELDSALVYSDRALEIWKKQDDTLQMANLYKYIGLLQGRIGEFVKAKSNLQEAIMMYREVGFEKGVAVSEINLADVYFENGYLAESDSLFLKSTKFWKESGDLGRVFTNNILGIRIYNRIGAKNEVNKLIGENRIIMDQVDLDEFIKNRF